MPNLPSIFDRSLSTVNPFRSVAKMQQQMDRLFDRMWNPASMDLDLMPGFDPFPISGSEFAFAPACDIEETDSNYVMSFDVPGVKKEDIKIDLRGHTLIVSGERKNESQQKGKNFRKSEVSYGAFQRSFDLAEDVKAEQIEAQYADGVLCVTIPKTKAAKAEQIKITEGKGESWGKSKH